MACRCPRSSRVFLPFLYPSLFSPGGIYRSGLAAALNGTRRSSTEAGASRLNPAPDDYSMPYFADKARLTIHAGSGGNGCISFLREAFMEDGPANGGDGGHGGNVYIQAVHGETSLHKLARRKVIRAGKGKSGMGSSRSGQRGEDVVIAVPVGTVVREISRDDPEGESRFLRKRHRRRKALPVEEGPDGEPIEDPDRHKWLIYPGISSSDMKRIELPRLPNRDPIFLPPKEPVHLDLSRPTPRPILLAAGGVGGLGNPHFVSKGTPKPMFATKGERAMSMEIELELKLLADVGLVGLPNAGKSTLLRSISNSRTRVGDWAFTTLQPNIGTVVLDNNKGRPMLTSYRKVSDAPPSRDDPFNTSSGSEPEFERRTRFTIADIPGLIEGAHLDKGLGIAFLRHVERAGVLAFVLDLGAGNAVKALKALWNEVGLYAQMREDEERERQRQAAIDWSLTAGTDVQDDTFWPSSMAMGPDSAPAVNAGGLHIAGKPWFVVATKGDLPDTRSNFDELREYLAAISRGDEPHPSGVEGAWTHDCRAIPGHRGGGRGGRGRDRDSGGGHRPYQTYPEYYDTILDLPEDEKADFWAALRRELPNSFRFCGSKGHALAVKRLLQTRYIPEITRITHEGVAVDPPKPVPWYPDGLAWSMTTPKNVIRKFPPFAAFQKFLVSETSVGNISRQEVVSMIPPLLMDVKPGMTVLDLCAAPGSKAAQLLEMIHRGEEARIRQVVQSFSADDVKTADEQEEEAARLEADPSDDGRATGMLIANDADYKRSHMLIHQLKRLSSPNMIVTNHDATMYPPLRIPNPENPSKPNYLKFDRILADVPCSGDGTLRKNVNLWKDWTPGNALGLHLTQVRILVRALQMLKPGGRVVYSTCSMNPVENEAVVAAAIERCGGPEKIEIIDCSDQLPLLKRKPGMRKWQIMDKSARLWNSWEEVQEYTKSTEDGIAPGRLVDSMFPPTAGSNCADLPLERCMRVYAHQQDTGGFFITALHKKSEFKAKPEENRKQPVQHAKANGKASAGKRPLEEDGKEAEGGVKKLRLSEEPVVKEQLTEMDTEVKTEMDTEVKTEVDTEVKTEGETEVRTEPTDPTFATPQVSTPAAAASELPEPKRKPDGPYEEPFKFLPPDHEVIKNVAEFYKISPRFPTDRYMVRNALGEPAKAIYYTSALVRDILVLNEGRGVKFVHGGVKMFVKQDAPSAEVCRWRIQSEGMPILHGYVGPERVVVLNKKETLKKLLIEMFPKIAGDDWKRMDEIGERVRDLALGCCVLRIEPEAGDEDFTEHMALPLWKSFQSLNLMLPKEDRSAMLLRIYNDTTPLINMGIQKDNKPKEQKAEEETDGDAQGKDAEMKDAEVKEEEEEAAAVGAADVEVVDAPAPEAEAKTDVVEEDGAGPAGGESKA
ncbi:mitochondrial GTPase 2-like protein [Chaetomium strumarium]|uniref:Mitochondrial GTPase 2-like protein n=1 Tax=Chaetomium strumarium TaxID=1170767 RepID=A0AAJ0M2G5_9PEZI|nr:mitochondrial GTPase 2-like protein [Chaetomium strumarium]